VFGKLISPSFFEQLLQHAADTAVIRDATMQWKASRTSTIAGISLLSILLFCLQPVGVPTFPYSSRANRSQHTAVWIVQYTYAAPDFP